MKISIGRNLLVTAMFTATIMIAAAVHAQFGAMGMPLPTTVIVIKPAPGEIYGDKPVITMGVGTKIYKFILKDAYVDDPANRIHWPDVWQLVRQYRPNFNVTGVDSNVFEKIEPGHMMTVKGMFAPLNQSFEVTAAEPGGGVFAPPTHY